MRPPPRYGHIPSNPDYIRFMYPGSGYENIALFDSWILGPIVPAEFMNEKSSLE